MLAGRVEGEGSSGGGGEGDALPGGDGLAVGLEGEVWKGWICRCPDEAPGGGCHPGVEGEVWIGWIRIRPDEASGGGCHPGVGIHERVHIRK